jgi:hypothetical protein
LSGAFIWAARKNSPLYPQFIQSLQRTNSVNPKKQPVLALLFTNQKSGRLYSQKNVDRCGKKVAGRSIRNDLPVVICTRLQ